MLSQKLREIKGRKKNGRRGGGDANIRDGGGVGGSWPHTGLLLAICGLNQEERFSLSSSLSLSLSPSPFLSFK